MKRLLTILSLSLCILTMNAQTDQVSRKPKQKPKTEQSGKKTQTVKPSQKTSKTSNAKTRTNSRSNSSSTNSNSPTLGTLNYTPDVKTFYANGVSFQMVEVRGGTFRMGATSEQGSDAYDDEKPAHSVTLSNYYIGRTEVTQALWKAVMGKSVSQIASENDRSTRGVGDNYPMYEISWDDCRTFISKLNAITGHNFRMPTEAEWEFAARGGRKSKGYKYSGSNYLDNVAWYTDNSNSSTHPVGTKSPNELGIYDMSGNVWEWCSDWYGGYSSYAQTNPTGAGSGSHRVRRGGSWDNFARRCRSSFRDYRTPDSRSNFLGLRLCLSE